MKLSLKLNLAFIVVYDFGTSTISLTFENITNLQQWDNTDAESVNKLNIDINNNNKTLYVFYEDDVTPRYDFQDADIFHASENGNYIKFDCEVNNSNLVLVLDWINKGFIEVNQDGKTTLFTYRLNCERDVLDKTYGSNLTFVGTLDGKFNHSIAIKNINIDLQSFAQDFNYVYIPSLKRYYYVDSLELISADFSRLHLKEDVLTSWKDLIKQQVGYVERTQYGSVLIEDSKRTTELSEQFEYTTLATSFNVSDDIIDTHLPMKFILNVLS